MDKFDILRYKNFKFPINKKNDEFDVLANSMNLFADKTKKYISDLERKDKELGKEIQQRIDADDGLKAQFSLYQNVLNSLRDSIVTIDEVGVIKQANKAAVKRFNVKEGGNIKDVSTSISISRSDFNDESSLVELSKLAFSPPNTVFSGYCQVSGKEIFPATILIRDTIFPGDGSGKIITFMVESESEKVREIEYNSDHDYLTDLFNRSRFEMLLSNLLTSTASFENIFLSFIDLDNLKLVNDVYGHAAGDMVISSIGNILKNTVGENDVTVRFGGDEFLVLLKGDIAEVNDVAENIHEEIKKIKLRNVNDDIYMTASIGLTQALSTDSARDLIYRADESASRVKRNGGAAVGFFSGDAIENINISDSSRHYAVIRQLANKLETDQLQIYCQEITPIQLKGKDDVRHELLIRFLENGTAVLPGKYLNISEQHKLTTKIDLWVLERLNQMLADNQVPYKRLNINLSFQSLTSLKVDNAVSRLMDIVQSTGHCICFEFTETSLLRTPEVASNFIEKYKLRGATFTIDDFGSGFASFGLLRSLDINLLKIDGSLIKQIGVYSAAQDMVSSLQHIGDSLDLLTVAEHTQNQAVLDQLIDIGINYSQSFLHSTPVPFEFPTQ